ncbi:hypothetical protein A0J61_09995 [Choanephora cucurbitarum]|uniref:Uncharacterized protein n=1 Tax=Choanephora cucurbitarum TaxID=101091 RepID=A0A1C7MYP7_9FUNG|nr:hypothetical protein A0J61_09995 [Choanephora cucurbitarum]
MTSSRKPKCGESLKSKFLNDKAREILDIPEYLLLNHYGNWNIESIVDDYFLFAKVPMATGHDLYSQAVDILTKFTESQACGNQTEKRFIEKFVNYLKRPDTKKAFLTYYKKCERNVRKEDSRQEVAEEVEITATEMVSDHLRMRSQKRQIDSRDGVDDSALQVKVRNKAFNIQSPCTVVPSNSPMIEEENITKMVQRVDICLSTNTIHASDETLEEYKALQASHRRNKSLSSIESAMNLLQTLNKTKKENALEEVAKLDCGTCKFNQFVKYSFIDFIINSMRITKIPVNDERTIYVEHVVQYFKYFANITGLMSFTWCEKKNKDAATTIFYITQEKTGTRLLDGMGSDARNNPCFVIESSGLKMTADVDHVLEDSLKNVQSATDAIKSIMCAFPNASTKTMKEIKVFSAHLIQTKLTLLKYSVKNKSTYKVVECSSALLPTTFEEKNYLIAVYDIFAFIYNELNEQHEVMQQLESEQLGLVYVEDKDMVSCDTW